MRRSRHVGDAFDIQQGVRSFALGDSAQPASNQDHYEAFKAKACPGIPLFYQVIQSWR